MAAALLTVSACTQTPPPVPTTTGSDGTVTAEVTATGVHLASDLVTVDAPAGVATAGTHLILKPREAPTESTRLPVTLLAGFDVAFSDGSQPAKPVTVSMTLPGTLAGKPLAFLTQPSGTGQWSGLPVTVNGTLATVELTHFSWGFFFDPGAMIGDLVKQFTNFMGQTFDPPACNGKTPTIDGVTYSAKVTGGLLYVCVESIDGKPILSVHSNSPYVWSIKSKLGGGRKPVPPNTVSGFVTAVAWDAVKNYTYDKETVLIPGGSASVSVPLSGNGLAVSASVEPVWGYVAILMAAIDTMLTVSGVSVGALDKAHVGECIAGIVENGADPDKNAGALTASVLGCVGTVVSGVGGMVIGLVTSLASLLVTQIRGIIDTITNATEATVTVSARGSTAVVSGHGIGPFTFGANEKDVIDYLTTALGKPKIEGGVGGCEEAGFGYQNYATFGDLRVRFAAADNSSSSPRTLQSWDARMASATQGGLTLASEIPFGLSLEQLKAKYPGNGGLENMGAWSAGDVLLIPHEELTGKELIHAGGLDWCI